MKGIVFDCKTLILKMNDSGHSCYKISLLSGIEETTLSQIKRDIIKPDNIRVKTLKKLHECANELGVGIVKG